MRYYPFLAGEYQIEKMLERSQYSVLGRARESATGQLVLLKLWLTAQVDSEEEQRRVRQEVAALQSIKHPYLLPILEVHLGGQRVYLVSEDVPGGSLNEQLGQESEDARSLDETLQIIEQVGQALQELHLHGIIHGNLTPQAVLFGEHGQVKLGDCLVQSVLANIPDYQPALDEDIPRCFYMAPEQFDGMLSAKTDQYALGCLAYVLLTGRVPFAGSERATLLQKHQHDEPRALTSMYVTLPEHIEVAVLKSLAKDPAERYSSVQDFLEALDVPGKKELADQYTLKQPVPSVLLVEMDPANKTWEWDSATPAEDAGPTSVLVPVPFSAVQPGFDRPVQSSLLVRPYPGQSARPSRRRELLLIVPAVLLVIALLFMTGRGLLFPAESGPVQPKTGTISVTQTPSLLTPVTATNTQAAATGTVVTLQIPTATPRPTVTTSPAASALLQVPLSSFFNNKGIGSAPGQANFDGSGYSYPASQMPAGGQITIGGEVYQFPANAPGANDNIIASGQTISLTQGKYHQALLLVSSSWGPVSGTITINYTNGSSALTNVTVSDWYDGPSNGLSTQERYTSSGIDPHAVYIFVLPITLDTTRVVKSLVLPAQITRSNANAHMHMFALTLVP
jgi:serine/threonine protein kinase